MSAALTPADIRVSCESCPRPTWATGGRWHAIRVAVKGVWVREIRTAAPKAERDAIAASLRACTTLKAIMES